MPVYSSMQYNVDSLHTIQCTYHKMFKTHELNHNSASDNSQPSIIRESLTIRVQKSCKNTKIQVLVA